MVEPVANPSSTKQHHPAAKIRGRPAGAVELFAAFELGPLFRYRGIDFMPGNPKFRDQIFVKYLC